MACAIRTSARPLIFLISSVHRVISSDSERTFKSHLGGRKHRAATKTPTLSNCLHSQGSAHQRRLSQLDVTPDPWYTVTEAEAPINSIRCDTCNQNIPRTWASHISKDSHIGAQEWLTFNFGTIDPNNAQEIKKVVTLRLNTPSRHNLKLNQASILSRTLFPGFSSFHVTEMDPIALPLKRLVSLPLYFRSLGHRGYFADRLELTFHDKSLRKSFTITRPLRATVGNVTDLEQLRPSAPYVRPPPKPRRDRERSWVDGIKPSSQRIEWVVELPKAIMPFQLRSIWKSRTGVDAKLTRVKQLPGMHGDLIGAGPPSYVASGRLCSDWDDAGEV
ncbi:RNA helicase [Rhizoctonia solani]|uniref:RNA helicase n=1 Tax=Rhizoctonia solani TaxID=456999 RepID=A0A8H8P7S7_9AGAM|nr:RNA helicase [Rhizoctonia solani]QRW27109.1 RNA helicase [Rhizoctonia solani]